MKIVIVGCSGFLGSELKEYFTDLGHSVDALSIRQNSEIREISKVLEGSEVLINLAGLSIFGRWTESYKEALYTSRINTTKKLIQALELCEIKPVNFISTSAGGIYPNDISCDETQKELSYSYLAHICRDWEEEALKANRFGIKTSVFRLGVILGKEGGMMKKLWLPFKLGLGGRLGSGEQPLSWIHIEDLKRAYLYALEAEGGIYNLCAPTPTTNFEFTNTLGDLLHRPTPFPIPAFVLRLLLKEGADFILEGQNVRPRRLMKEGFKFHYSTIKEALKSFL